MVRSTDDLGLKIITADSAVTADSHQIINISSAHDHMMVIFRISAVTADNYQVIN